MALQTPSAQVGRARASESEIEPTMSHAKHVVLHRPHQQPRRTLRLVFVMVFCERKKEKRRKKNREKHTLQFLGCGFNSSISADP